MHKYNNKKHICWFTRLPDFNAENTTNVKLSVAKCTPDLPDYSLLKQHQQHYLRHEIRNHHGAQQLQQTEIRCHKRLIVNTNNQVHFALQNK